MSALTFYPLPQERKWLSAVSGLADHHPINPVAVFSKRRRTILPLQGERAGVRASVNTNSTANVEEPVFLCCFVPLLFN
jgi:hypothetical protein